MTKVEAAMSCGQSPWLSRPVTVNRRQHPRRIPVMLRLAFKIPPHSLDAHTTDTAGEISARPNWFWDRELSCRITLQCLERFRNRVRRLEAEQAKNLSCAGVEFEQVIVLPDAYLVKDVREMHGPESQEFAPAMRAKAKIIMKLISPREASERSEEHRAQNRFSKSILQGWNERSTN